MTESISLHDRQQEIITILREQSSAKVTELSQLLGVSQVTIRSDLDVLEEAGIVERIRGGAILRDGYQILTPALAQRARVNEPAKHRIARRAADMVEDGDLILLDDSTTTLNMVPYLKKRKNLTIVTNGVETALALSQDSQHTVILLGGILHNKGASVVGPIGESNLRSLRCKTAFLSCTGFSLDLGMTQSDLQEAQLKRQMIEASQQVIALVDASKFDKTDLTPFAPIDSITHLLTDDDVEQTFIDILHHVGTTVTICRETTISTLTPSHKSDQHYRIGFANLGEDQSEFVLDVRYGLEKAARKIGNIDLVMGDNRLDADVALEVADQLVANGVDLAIEYQINEQIGGTVSSKFHEAQIPVIAVDIPMVGATYFGVDNYRSGHMAGTALGHWIQENWDGYVDTVLVLQHAQAGQLTAARMHGQVEGLQTILGDLPSHILTPIDDGTTKHTFEELVEGVLVDLPETNRVAILSFNDSATLGALQAAYKVNRSKNLVIVGQGADRLVRAEIRRPESPVIGATAFWPERYGERLIEIAMRILKGEKVPPAVYIEHVFLDANNINDYYLDDELEA